MKGFSSKHIALNFFKRFVLRPENILFLRRVRASFSPEILQAGAVKGLMMIGWWREAMTAAQSLEVSRLALHWLLCWRFKSTVARASRPQKPPLRTIRDGEPRKATSTFTQLLSSEVQVHCCFKSTETILRTIWDGEPRTATSTFTQLLSSEVQVQCCFTSTETIWDGEPRTATSTFTQLLQVGSEESRF